MLKHAHIVGWGAYLPEQVITNNEIAMQVATSDEWIVARTGISERRVAAVHETTASLAIEAAYRALDSACIDGSDIGLVIVATSTPEFAFPSTACTVQDAIGANQCAAFDLSAACSGFVYALETAANALAVGSADYALVIGSETMTRVLDWEDRSTCILFGDGAGAVVLKASEKPGGIIASQMHSDGSGGNLLQLPFGYQEVANELSPDFLNGQQAKRTVTMNGSAVFRFATRAIAQSVLEVIEKANMTIDDIDIIIPHQANARIIASSARRLKLPPERFFVNVAKVANTSAASIPVALCEASAANRLKPNDNIILVGFGGGLTWGATLLRWNPSSKASA